MSVGKECRAGPRSGTGRWKAADAGCGTQRGRGSTIVPGVQRAPNPFVSHACGTWKPRPGSAIPAGRPTVRKAESLGGNRMTREANADTPKGNGKDITSSVLNLAG